MPITKITAQQKQPNRVSIFVDSIYSFSLTIDQLIDSKLKIGDELGDEDIKYYERLSAEGKLKARTLEWLTLRPRSRRELLQYLVRKGQDQEIAEAWADEFERRKYQDDQVFADWWVAQRRSGKQRSERHIRSELQNKGVSADIISSALGLSDISDQQALRTLIVKKRRLTRYRDDQKLMTYLQRQGYRYSDIAEALADGVA